VNLVLIGPPGSGKTRLGKRVARILGVPFIDTDRVIVASHGPVAEIFAEHGEPYFRELEREAVAQALASDAVISLGGGAVLNLDTQADLGQHLVALITVSAEAVASRITDSKRPLLSGGIDSWVALYESRRELYERLGDRAWDTSNRPIEAIAAEIAEWASTQADAPAESAPGGQS
jgi:shikimate kinase